MTKFNNIETTLVQIGNRTDPRTGAVAMPIILSTAYGRDGLGESTGWITPVPKTQLELY